MTRNKTPSPIPPLIRAVFQGDLAALERLLAQGEDANAADPDGRTALHQAVIGHRADLCKVLLAHNANVNAQDPFGFAPLHFAAQEYTIETANVLLQHSATVDIQNQYGNTPLFVAVFHSKGRGEMIQLLLTAGANPDVANHRGVSPRKLADLIANYDMRQFFKDR